MGEIWGDVEGMGGVWRCRVIWGDGGVGVYGDRRIGEDRLGGDRRIWREWRDVGEMG